MARFLALLLAVLPAAALAAPPLPANFNGIIGGVAQCAKALTQLSCNSKYAVDANSTATCCYNGALHPGEEESGLVLLTQFWNAQNPSVGPADSSTLHGIWPDFCSGRYPEYCSKSSGIPEYTGANITAILAKYSPKTLDYMNVYWLDYQGKNEEFYEHEYNKHGTCFSALRAQCQLPAFDGRTPEESAVIAYFEEAVKRFKALPTYKWLAEAGIVPSNTTTYTREQIVSALAKRTGAVPFIGCSGRPNRNTLSEFWYYYHTYGPVRGGVYVPTNATYNSTCPTEGIRYLPK